MAVSPAPPQCNTTTAADTTPPPPPQVPNTATAAAAGLITSAKSQISPLFTYSIAQFNHIYPQSRDYILAKGQGERSEALWNHMGSRKQYIEGLWGRSIHGLSEASGLNQGTVKFLLMTAFVGCTGVSLWPIEVGKMMIAPGRGGGVQMLRSVFEADPKTYFRDLRANRGLAEKTGMNGYAGYLILGYAGVAFVRSGAGERLYTEAATHLRSYL